MALNKKSQEENVVAEAVEAAAEKVQDVIQQEVLEHEPEVVESTKTEVAVRQQTQLAVPASTHGIGVNPELVKTLQDQGFAVAELDYHSLANIKLQQEFEGPEGVILPSDGFYVQPTGSRPKWAATSKHEKDAEREAVFVYDKNELNDPNSKVSEAVARWKEQGVGWGWKPYMDVFCTMLHDGLEENSLVGKMCVLSIPEKSMGRWTVTALTMQAKHGGFLRDLVVKVSRGNKIKEAIKPFYPWKFDDAGKLADFVPPGEE